MTILPRCQMVETHSKQVLAYSCLDDMANHPRNSAKTFLIFFWYWLFQRLYQACLEDWSIMSVSGEADNPISIVKGKWYLWISFMIKCKLLIVCFKCLLIYHPNVIKHQGSRSFPYSCHFLSHIKIIIVARQASVIIEKNILTKHEMWYILSPQVLIYQLMGKK